MVNSVISDTLEEEEMLQKLSTCIYFECLPGI